MAKFWKRPSQPENGDPPIDLSKENKTPGHSDPLLEQTALDQLAAVMRTLGKYAFDLDEIKASAIGDQVEIWVRHILMATPQQNDEDQADEDRKTQATARRDWAGLQKFVATLRRGEQAYVKRQVVGTRQVMGDFVQTLGRVLAEDQDEQARVLSAIDQLRLAIEEDRPLEVVSQEAILAIDLIREIAQERSQRHQGLLQELTGKLQSLRGELDAAQREMEIDSLTRLYNRKAFDIQLERVFELCRLSGQPACLMMIDADHFKRINDDYGHPVGDLVLKRIAKCCLQSFPRKTDFVARYGGEEFAVVLQDTPMRTAFQLGDRLLDVVRDMEIEHEEVEEVIRITLSIGVAELDPKATPSQWLSAADAALYQAKGEGRDRIVTSQGSSG
ncbi:GGDEF domain-containing protein [Imhoffiella purpurea]|uniref:diguanylate cyclase n=1 Tax=Imhoffiella purpurea TaxID=1249627 RepID=W9V259_9GAMM|nr:GGDEF domain-containing protein [Imhoffiella purpurea]EXJ13389.1 GGDEF domain protein [Imhoffiella purpurea]